MLLKYFYDTTLAQASYLIGCQECGEALVVDPARDYLPYLEAAKAEGLQIRHVTETHIHADFVSGARGLAAEANAKLYLSSLGGPAWQYGYTAEHISLLSDGDVIEVGNVRLKVMHTPGHTPEHLSFVLTDTKLADHPMGIFTGDFLFVGDVGRPDLLDKVGGAQNTQEQGARDLFRSLQKLKDLPDYLQIWPGHGAGSACGKSLGAVPSSTLGYERLFNPALQIQNEDAFVSWLLAGQPEAPRYFGQMKRVNKTGPEFLRNLDDPEHLPANQLPKLVEMGALVVDLRREEAFLKDYLPGTLSVPANSGTYTTYIGWFVDYSQPLYFIAPDEDDMPEILKDLRAIGIDNTPGYFTAKDVSVQQNTEPLSNINAQELAKRLPEENMFILDVRNATEYEAGHLKGAKHIPLGYLPQRLTELPKDRLIAAHCASGYRSQIAASYLRNKGFNAMVVKDSFERLAEVLPKE